MKKEKRSFFKDLFTNKNKTINKTTYQIVNGYNSVFTLFGNDFYENDEVRACIDTISRHCAKFLPKHIQAINRE